jgi:hypothetical protein
MLALIAGVKLAGEPSSRRELLPEFEDEEFDNTLGQSRSEVPVLTCSIQLAGWPEFACPAWAGHAGCAGSTSV